MDHGFSRLHTRPVFMIHGKDSENLLEFYLTCEKMSWLERPETIHNSGFLLKSIINVHDNNSNRIRDLGSTYVCSGTSISGYMEFT